MLRYILIMVLLVGFVLQLWLIQNMFNLYERMDKGNDRMLSGLISCMQSCQSGKK